jgi:hypothetical protein
VTPKTGQTLSPGIQYVVIAIWLIGGVYLGVAGWIGMKALEETAVVHSPSAPTGHGVEYHGLVFRDEQSALDFIQEQRSTRLAPWMFDLPAEILPLVACLGFGVVGGAARLLKILALERVAVSSRALFSDPIFGGVIGFAFVVIAWTLPSIVTTAKGPVRAETLAALALCGGLFSEQAFARLEKAATGIFNK